MEGWRGVRHRAAAPAVRSGGASGWKGGAECEAQGGCACCAVREAMVRRALDEMVRY